MFFNANINGAKFLVEKRLARINKTFKMWSSVHCKRTQLVTVRVAIQNRTGVIMNSTNKNNVKQ